MNRDDPRAYIEQLANDHQRRRQADPEGYKSYIDLIRIVSEEIYSENSHFVYELIQNAEDNRYLPQCRDRYVEFTLDAGCIVVRNNETGFSADNVKALCSVAKSTKFDKTLGYVGEKGIGFKSVFKVSARPQIHSNGFHFAFDDEEMIVPRWFEPAADLPLDGAATTIVLPLREEIRDDPEQALREDFLGLPAETLLFLSNLNRIRILDRIEGTTRELTRRGGRHGLVAIDDGESSTRWRIHHREVEVPPHLKEKKRKGVQRRELILGFQTDSCGTCLRLQDAPPVFAFLPTSLKPGLPFLVQGDFLTTANRESIHVGSEWNRWLRDELAVTYIEALREAVRESEPFRLSFLQTLPDPDRISSLFFRPAAWQILKAIAEEPLFPGESGALRVTGKLLLGDETLRRLFPSESLATLLGREVEYLDARFVIPNAIARHLPIADVADELTVLLSDREWLGQREDDWFIDLYSYLNEHPELIEDDELKSLPIVRLEGGRLAAADEGTVYLPPSEERVEESYGLKRFEFRIVSHAVVRRHPSPRKEEEKLLNRRTQAARSFLLDCLDVKHHRALEIVWNQVLPHLDDASYESPDDLKADFGLVLYIKEHWGQIQKDADDDEMDHSLFMVVSALGRLPLPVVGVRKRREVRPAAEAYLPPELGGDTMLARLFQGVPDVWFVDAELLAEWDTTRKRRDRKLKEWQGFLADIGAARHLRLVHHPVLYRDERPIRVPREFDSGDRLIRVEDSCEIDGLDRLFDYLSDKAPSTRIEKGRLLLKLLDRQWGAWEARLVQAIPWWQSTYWYNHPWKRRSREEARTLPCAFLQRLREEAWVPVRGDGPPRRPNEVWVSDDDGGLGLAEGHRLGVVLDNPGLVAALGFRTHLTIAELLTELRERVAREQRDLHAYRQLYSLLDQAWHRETAGNRLVEEFRSIPRLIYLPNRSEFPFAASDEVAWKTGRQRQQGFPALEGAYPPSLRSFFQKLGVAERATPQLALETLRQVADSLEDAEEEVGGVDRVRLREAYQVLADADFARDGGSEELRAFLDVGLVLADDGAFHPCREVIAPDDATLAELFRGQGVGRFLWMPEAAGDGGLLARRLGELFGLRRIGDAERRITYVASPPDARCEEVGGRLDTIRRHLLGFIRKIARPRYEALVTSGQAAVLARAPVRFCDEITVGYLFGGRAIADSRRLALSLDATGLYLRADHLEDLLEVGADLQATLGVEGLAEGFYTLMSQPSNLGARHAERQGYLVPELEWQDLTGPVVDAPALPEGYDSAPPDEAADRGGWPTGPPSANGDAPGHTLSTTRREASGSEPSDRPRAASEAIASDPRPARRAPTEATAGPHPRHPEGEDGDPRPGPHRSSWTPPDEGEAYDGPTRFRPPRGSNRRLADRLGKVPERREAREYLQGPPATPDLVGGDVLESDPPPTRIRTILCAVNLEFGFLRFVPEDFRIFEPECPPQIDLVADDDEEWLEVSVDYVKGIVHGEELTEFLESQAWTYGTILWLDATINPVRFHLHAETLEAPLTIGPVEYFDIDDHGRPVVKTSHPEPFMVSIDENMYRQERRWENRRAYDALVARKGDGVLTAVFDALETAPGPMNAAEIHRRLMAGGRPCSYFSVLAVLYGFECFSATDDHCWELTEAGPAELREGYRALLEAGEGGDHDLEKDSTPGRTEIPRAEGAAPLGIEELSRLQQDLRLLTRPNRERWIDAIDRLMEALERLRRSLLERV